MSPFSAGDAEGGADGLDGVREVRQAEDGEPADHARRQADQQTLHQAAV